MCGLVTSVHERSLHPGMTNTQAGIEYSGIYAFSQAMPFILARWGGGEFMLNVPDADVEAAARQAKKLRALIERGDFGAIGRVTCSFGVTQFRDGDTPDDFIGRADAAMYAAKRNGRNRVECYEKGSGVSG